MKRILTILLCAAALSGVACTSVGPRGMTTVLTDFEQLAFEQEAGGGTRFAASGVSTSRPIGTLGSTATTLGMQSMLKHIAGGFFRSKDNEITQLEGTRRHLASKATEERLAEIGAARAAEEAAAAEAAATVPAVP